MKRIPLSDFAKHTARLLTTRYLIALAAVALLSIAGQVLVQVALSRQAHDARIINLGGRQRNYSQALCKGVIATRNLPPAEADEVWRETAGILETWTRVHHGLQTGDAQLDLPSDVSAAVRERLADLEPAFIDLAGRIHRAVTSRTLPEDQVSGLLISQRAYLKRMEAVVGQLDREASERVSATRILEASLFAILGVVLVIEGLVIFRPVVRRIRHEISAREQAEQAAIEREVAEVSGRLERRIGQDLHDGLGQVLTGISFQSKALQRRLGSGPEADSAADITTQVAQAIGQTRSLARLLHPVEADAHSLGAALRDLGTTSERVFGLQTVVHWDDDLPVPPTSAEDDDEHHDTPPSMHLFRITQEAVSNAIRHGKATHLWITGAIDGKVCELVIADDGIGFDPPRAAAMHHMRTGMGLRIMAFRAERIGASFAIERRPEGGMRLTLRWPAPSHTAPAPG